MSLCLVTRTQPGADVSVRALQEMGYDARAVPAAIIIATHNDVQAEGVQALLMTSAAAARHVDMTPALAALPVYAVGDATAAAAAQAGFETVISAGGDGATLAVLAADRMKPSDGPLLHLRGNDVAGDVTGMLNACGFETRMVEIYQTKDHPDFRAKVREIVREHDGAIVCHSPAGARRLAMAIEEQGLKMDKWRGFGLSPACIAPLEKLGFKALFTAERPDDRALLDTISLHHPHSRP